MQNKLIQINLKLTEKQIEQLKSIARQESAKRDKDVNYLELIKEALITNYKIDN